MRRAAAALALALTLALVGAAAAASARAPRVTFYFGLERPEAAARAAFFAVQAPSSPTYRSFLGAQQAARRYGASAATVRALRRAGRRHHLRVRVDPSRVFARVSAPVPRLERVFHVRVRRQYNNETLSWAYYVGRRKRLRLPRDMRPLVREVVLSFSRSQRSERKAKASAGPANAGTWAGGCEAARATGGYSYAQVRHAYGLDRVGGGAGASVAIVNVGEGLAAADIAANANCFGYPAARLRTLLADGQARPFPRSSFEPQEDLALVRGMAPQLGSLTFAQTWLATELWFLGPAEVLDAPHLPDSLSISYGECERSVRGPHAPPAERAGANLMDAVLVRLGLAGVSSFASAGDFGSTCNGQPFPGVAWPASSPFLTAVGGTRLALNAANERSEEVVWNDTPWTSAEEGEVSAAAVSPTSPSIRPTRRRSTPPCPAAPNAARFPTSPPTPRCSPAGPSSSPATGNSTAAPAPPPR